MHDQRAGEAYDSHVHHLLLLERKTTEQCAKTMMT